MAGIYKVILHGENPDRGWTVHMHYQNVTPTDSGMTPTDALAEAFWNQIVANELKDLLSDACALTCVRTFRRDNIPAGEPPGLFRARQAGIHPSEPLPVNEGVAIDVVQSVFGRRSNGRNVIPGLPEEFVLGTVYNQTYSTNHVQPFLAALGPLVLETPDAGQWRLGVFSEKFLAANPGDYEGAFADATGAGASPVISGNRTRRTKRDGVPV